MTESHDFERAVATVEGSVVANYLLRELMEAMGESLHARPDTPAAVWRQMLDKLREHTGDAG